MESLSSAIDTLRRSMLSTTGLGTEDTEVCAAFDRVGFGMWEEEGGGQGESMRKDGRVAIQLGPSSFLFSIPRSLVDCIRILYYLSI